jgi:diaminopimelate decarboxylase
MERSGELGANMGHLEDVLGKLRAAAGECGTPSYVYFLSEIQAALARLKTEFGQHFKVSYAVKANPNRAILERILPDVISLDVSSAGELERALAAGCDAERITFSGPAKRVDELDLAIRRRCGEIVCESLWELEELNRLAEIHDSRPNILLRINPKTAPRSFGVRMSGRPSQFGIDEEELDEVLERLPDLNRLRFRGFHIFSATNSLSEEGLAENFSIMAKLFARFSDQHDLVPEKLIFGSGFGIPYHDGEAPLDLHSLAARVGPVIDAMKMNPRLRAAECVLEMGRYIVGPSGFFLTSVVNEKTSRGTEIRMCDGGLHHHIAACGLMGMVIRRNYPMWNVTARVSDTEAEYMLVGPLCTSIDVLAPKIVLPRVERGSVIAIGSSGAYGLTISPSEFISHPRPKEWLLEGDGAEIRTLDISES